tara:strand:- start:3373 stop:4002 length:630 start_codon:yes stop_codon:yes gene_type:complete
MLQNKYSFNQSAVELEITGLPDYSNDDNKEKISIITSWKMSIINQPEIEGNLDHLKSVIKAFYKFAALALLDREENVESELIDLYSDKSGKYNITLKSTKPNIKPLKLNIGRDEFSDIINCFDQLKNSTIINLDFNNLLPELKIKNPFSLNKNNLFDTFFPPLIAIFSISMFSLISIYFYEKKENRNDNISVLSKTIISNHANNMIKIK